jgi:hypothetical protein
MMARSLLEAWTYNHNHRPTHDNRTQEDSRSNLANQDSHWWLEENVGDEEHQDDDGLDPGFMLA